MEVLSDNTAFIAPLRGNLRLLKGDKCASCGGELGDKPSGIRLGLQNSMVMRVTLCTSCTSSLIQEVANFKEEFKYE